MGVHQDKDVYDDIKHILDIPLDEPIMILRGQDQLATFAITDYIGRADKICSREFIADLVNLSQDFTDWKVRNPDKIKVPD